MRSCHSVLLLCLALFASGVGATAADLPKLKLVLDWYPEPEYGGYYCAASKGLWKAEGVDVEIIAGGPNASCEKRVSIDESTLGICRGDAVLLAQERGLPVVAVNSYIQHDPQGIMVRENSTVKTLSDLNGKTVAMVVGSTFITYLVKQLHLNEMKIVPATGSVAQFVNDPSYIQQAYPTSEPYYALKAGVKTRVLPINGSGFDPYRVIGANQKLVKEHPELIAAFSRGAYKGWVEYCRDPEPVHATIKKANPSMEDEGMRFSYREMRRLHYIEGEASQGDAFGKVDLSRWDTLQRQMINCGLMKRTVDLKAAVSEAFTPEKLGMRLELPPAFAATITPAGTLSREN